MSFVNVFDMVLGAFDIETFRKAPYWMLSVSFFILFMVFVNIVMLNALIAIMVRASHLYISTAVQWMLRPDLMMSCSVRLSSRATCSPTLLSVSSRTRMPLDCTIGPSSSSR